MSTNTSLEFGASDTDWPLEDLEHLQSCPACGAASRSVRFDELRDKAFRTGSGSWKMYDCSTCGAAYLNPRPSPGSIHRAYVGYYTQRDTYDHDNKYFWRHNNLKAKLKTDYLNREYGYRFKSGTFLGDALIRMHRNVRREIDYLVRHLPAPAAEGDKILDVGCGNGAFVALANALGFRAVGIDPDPVAIAAGRASGLDLRIGLLPDPSFTEGGFAHLTFHHVLEHLHDPRAALRESFDMLIPGGRIWLSQPNLGALGLLKFGKNWRGLEAPRHLTLVDFAGLTRLLASIGFERIQLMPSEEAAEFYYRQSTAMANDLDPYGAPDPGQWTAAAQAEANSANRISRRKPELSESLTVVAWRPQ